jgi:hypothetical protein
MVIAYSFGVPRLHVPYYCLDTKAYPMSLTFGPYTPRIVPTKAADVKVKLWDGSPVTLASPVTVTNGRVSFAVSESNRYEVTISNGYSSEIVLANLSDYAGIPYDITDFRSFAGADQGAVGPKGDKGDTGAQGPKGDTGAAGAAGTPGTPGAAGAKGDTGAAGTPGTQGTPGTPGTAGATGPGVATGGTTGQILSKSSATNFATAWITPPKGAAVADSAAIDIDGANAKINELLASLRAAGLIA